MKSAGFAFLPSLLQPLLPHLSRQGEARGALGVPGEGILAEGVQGELVPVWDWALGVWDWALGLGLGSGCVGMGSECVGLGSGIGFWGCGIGL